MTLGEDWVRVQSKLVKLDGNNIDQVINDASATVKSGGVIAFLTDTFYGLGCDPFNEEAVEHVFAIKQRRADMPLLILIDDIKTVTRISSRIPDGFNQLANTFWPGPLTIVIPAAESLPDSLTAGTGTIGVRLPNSLFAASLAAACGGAITATSANRSGGPNPLSAEDVSAQLGDQPDLIIDGGAAQPVPSTVITLCDEQPTILRIGAVSEFELRTVLPGFVVKNA
ncbi:MAG TPA: L-threonylcarbamoyladenylate synthase [Blastocatellia bacterium]|nr:L-threonylcarbamoyladenylate synthase [Blastocatellia bacterium]